MALVHHLDSTGWFVFRAVINCFVKTTTCACALIHACVMSTRYLFQRLLTPAFSCLTFSASAIEFRGYRA